MYVCNGHWNIVYRKVAHTCPTAKSIMTYESDSRGNSALRRYASEMKKKLQ